MGPSRCTICCNLVGASRPAAILRHHAWASLGLAGLAHRCWLRLPLDRVRTVELSGCVISGCGSLVSTSACAVGKAADSWSEGLYGCSCSVSAMDWCLQTAVTLAIGFTSTDCVNKVNTFPTIWSSLTTSGRLIPAVNTGSDFAEVRAILAATLL